MSAGALVWSPGLTICEHPAGNWLSDLWTLIATAFYFVCAVKLQLVVVYIPTFVQPLKFSGRLGEIGTKRQRFWNEITKATYLIGKQGC